MSICFKSITIFILVVSCTFVSLQILASSDPDEIVFDCYFDKWGPIQKHHSHIIADSNGITVTDSDSNGITVTDSDSNGITVTDSDIKDSYKEDNTYTNYTTNEIKSTSKSYYKKNRYKILWGIHYNGPGTGNMQFYSFIDRKTHIINSSFKGGGIDQTEIGNCKESTP